MRRVSNAISEEPGEVPDNEVSVHLGNPGSGNPSEVLDNEVNAHPGNPGLLVRLESLPRYFGLLNTRVR
jgi:hypothetical protein